MIKKNVKNIIHHRNNSENINNSQKTVNNMNQSTTVNNFNHILNSNSNKSVNRVDSSGTGSNYNKFRNSINNSAIEEIQQLIVNKKNNKINHFNKITTYKEQNRTINYINKKRTLRKSKSYDQFVVNKHKSDLIEKAKEDSKKDIPKISLKLDKKNDNFFNKMKIVLNSNYENKVPGTERCSIASSSGNASYLGANNLHIQGKDLDSNKSNFNNMLTSSVNEKLSYKFNIKKINVQTVNRNFSNINGTQINQNNSISNISIQFNHRYTNSRNSLKTTEHNEVSESIKTNTVNSGTNTNNTYTTCSAMNDTNNSILKSRDGKAQNTNSFVTINANPNNVHLQKMKFNKIIDQYLLTGLNYKKDNDKIETKPESKIFIYKFTIDPQLPKEMNLSLINKINAFPSNYIMNSSNKVNLIPTNRVNINLTDLKEIPKFEHRDSRLSTQNSITPKLNDACSNKQMNINKPINNIFSNPRVTEKKEPNNINNDLNTEELSPSSEHSQDNNCKINTIKETPKISRETNFQKLSRNLNSKIKNKIIDISQILQEKVPKPFKNENPKSKTPENNITSPNESPKYYKSKLKKLINEKVQVSQNEEYQNSNNVSNNISLNKTVIKSNNNRLLNNFQNIINNNLTYFNTNLKDSPINKHRGDIEPNISKIKDMEIDYTKTITSNFYNPYNANSNSPYTNLHQQLVLQPHIQIQKENTKTIVESNKNSIDISKSQPIKQIPLITLTPTSKYPYPTPMSVSMSFKNDKSDDECTFSGDELAEITHVPVFNSKKLENYNFSSNSNSNSNQNSITSNKFHSRSHLKSIKNKKIFNKFLLIETFLTIFKFTHLKESILSFLQFEDIICLLLSSRFLYSELKFKIYTLIVELIIDQNSQIVREKIWRSIYNYSNLSKVKFLRKEYLNNLYEKSPYEDQVKKDLARTLPDDISFKPGKVNYKKLFNVLISYSNYNTKIGYAQGLNFIVANAILILEQEEEVFIFVDGLMNKFNFINLIGLENENFLRDRLDEIGALLEKKVPLLVKFLKNNYLNHEFFTTNWIITIFSNSVKTHLVFKIWDFFLIYGWKFINCFIISILNIFTKEIMSYDPNVLSVKMKNLLKSDLFDQTFRTIVYNSFILFNE